MEFFSEMGIPMQWIFIIVIVNGKCNSKFMLKISPIRNNVLYGIRVYQGEAHKLSDMLNHVFLNKEHCINVWSISDICRVMGVESAEDCEALFHNCHKMFICKHVK